MKKRLAFAVLALLPLAASAQVPIPGRPATAGGITVQGRGSARYPVKTVQFAAQVRGVADEASVLSAMRAAGIDDPVLGPQGSMISRGTGSLVRGTIREVTQAKLERIGVAATQYIAAHPGAALDNVVLFPTPEECAVHEQVARTAALADARHKADAIAALAGVSIDSVAAVNENGGCPYGTDTAYQAYGNAQLDVARLTATVTVLESVTYAISTATGPTRRRPL
jgi:uncharacterized protein YggE